jgi:hypothetical protein
VCCAAIRQVVAIDHREHHVREIHLCERAGDVLRLGVVDDTSGMTAGYRAKPTAARANITQDHDGCSTFTPAFPNVGTTRFFAHGVKAQSTEGLCELGVPLATGDADLQPFGFAFM